MNESEYYASPIEYLAAVMAELQTTVARSEDFLAELTRLATEQSDVINRLTRAPDACHSCARIDVPTTEAVKLLAAWPDRTRAVLARCGGYPYQLYVGLDNTVSPSKHLCDLANFGDNFYIDIADYRGDIWGIAYGVISYVMVSEW